MFGGGSSNKDAEYKAMFEQFDADNSGAIDKQDLVEITKGMIPESSLEMIFKYVDKSGDGKIDFNEFKSVMKKVEMAKKMIGGKWSQKYSKKIYTQLNLRDNNMVVFLFVDLIIDSLLVLVSTQI